MSRNQHIESLYVFPAKIYQSISIYFINQSFYQLTSIFQRPNRAKPDPLALYSSWADQYGDVVSFKVGPMTFVLLNSYEVIVEAFSHPNLNNRPKSQMVEEALGLANNGIYSTNFFDVWKRQQNNLVYKDPLH